MSGGNRGDGGVHHVEPLPKKGNLFIDFEFNRTWARHVNLVCAVVRVEGVNHRYWLHNDREAQRVLARDLARWLNEYRLVCHGAIAESRSLIALGLDPLQYEIVDTWAEVRQLHNHNNKFEYGRYFGIGGEKKSVAPHIIPAMNFGKDMHPIGTSLVDAMGFFLGKVRNSAEKEVMRRLIIDDLPDYTAEQQKKIMDYCEEDVVDLPALYQAIAMAELEELKWTPEQLIKAHTTRGSDSASMALCETEGIPLGIEAAHNLSRNVEEASNALITELVTNHYPFFEKKPDNSWVQSYQKLEEFINGKALGDKWPRTTSGKYAADEDTLEDYAGISEINQLRKTRKILGQLKWFRDESWAYFYSHVDIYEHRLRCWLNPFGTQSNRNAPPAKVFVPAMSNWLRCLIQPREGQAITGIDWSSQEFAIAAVMSKDPKMLEAYRFGDPYVYFAMEAGAIPKHAQPKWVKKPGTAPEEVREMYEKYSASRDLFKATVLGLQYGMGVEKLSRKLTMDTGKEVTVNDATQLRDMHKRVFHVYWAWLDAVTNAYSREPLTLYDGWTIFMDNPSALSVKNFPVQGTGSAIMRLAVRLAQRRGIKVSFPLHDAIYIIHDEGDKTAIETLEKCMDEAVETILGKELYIRHEGKTVTNTDPWVEKRGEDMYNLLKEYLTDRLPVEDGEKKLPKRRKKTASEKNS
jgi:hypothetical protein